jgi:CHAT domain-containing protein
MLFVDYAVLPNEVVIWSVSKSGWQWRSLKVKRDAVAALVRRFAREADRVDRSGDDAASALFELLIAPLGAALHNTPRIAIAPDRELTNVPFAALWDRQRRRYLIEDHEIRTEASAASMFAALRLSPRTSRAPTALVVGNPAIGNQIDQLGRLPGAEDEARAVRHEYGENGRLLVGADARRDTLVSLLPKYSVLHFAGHAVFNQDDPAQSYLVLSGDSGAQLLQASEIASMRLTNLKLVVLSSCSTMRSRESRSGVVAGLAYSFLQAGAPGAVSTLWDVDDAATSEMLVDFHRRYRKGVPPAEALRRAQISALVSPRLAARAPSAWAAFVYSGS